MGRRGRSTPLSVKLKALDLLDKGVPQATVARQVEAHSASVKRWRSDPKLVAEWQKTRGKVWKDPVAGEEPGGAKQAEADKVLEAAETAGDAEPSCSVDPLTADAGFDADLIASRFTGSGRRPKFVSDPSILNRLAGAMANGLPIKWACYRARLTPETFRSWTKLAEEGKPGYVELLSDLRWCQSLGIEACLARISDGQPGWNGAAWRLERTHPEEFGRRDLEPIREIGAAEELDDDALLAVIDAFREARRLEAETEAAAPSPSPSPTKCEAADG